MPAQKISIENLLSLRNVPILDVRSPSEYEHAHIPGAHSLPLFSDEERKEVGTMYVQTGRAEAIDQGLDFFIPKMAALTKRTEKIISETQTTGADAIVLHCWRGGMRSAAVAWLMNLYGFKVYTLEGGYKSFRHWVLSQFQKDFNFHIIGGYTGSGKTPILHELRKMGETIIDLEGLANHKGSAFGNLDRNKQPSNEMLENLIAMRLHEIVAQNPGEKIWVEDESQRIGDLNLPIELWNLFRSKPLFVMNIPFEKRVQYIVQEYSHHTKESISNAIGRIQKRLGGLETKYAIRYLQEDDYFNCFAILLKYYDKHYHKSLISRVNLDKLKRDINSDEVNPSLNAKKILSICHEPINNGN